MIGAAVSMGIRAASSLLLGAALNFVVVVPVMISLGEIQPRAGAIAEVARPLFGRAHISTPGRLWWGITMMVVAAMWPFLRVPTCSWRRSAASHAAVHGPCATPTYCATSSCRCRCPGSGCR